MYMNYYPQQKEYPKNQFKEKTQQERKSIKSIDWNCNGTYLASGDSTIKIWSFDGNNIKKFTDIKQGSEQLEKLLFHPTQPDIIASITKENAKIWDIRAKQSIRQEKSEQLGVATWNPNGNELVSVVRTNKENSILFLDLGGGQDRFIQYPPKDKDKNFEIKSICYDPLGDVLAVGGQQNGVGMLQLLDGQNPQLPPLEQFEAHRLGISAIKFTKDGQYMLTGSYDSLILIWKLPELLLAGTIQNIESEIRSITTNFDSKYFAAIGVEDQTYIYSLEQCLQNKSDPVDVTKLEGPPQEICYHPLKQLLGFVCYDKNDRNKQESVIHLYGYLGV
ncbi:hypothetical protein pb186bvf_012079 [Paramecium bursaria]